MPPPRGRWSPKGRSPRWNWWTRPSRGSSASIRPSTRWSRASSSRPVNGPGASCPTARSGACPSCSRTWPAAPSAACHSPMVAGSAPPTWRPATPRWWRATGPPGWCSSAAAAHLNSASCPPPNPPSSVPAATPGTPPVPPAAPVAAQQPPSPRAWCPSPTPAISAARSAFPPRPAGCSASSRAVAATPWVRCSAKARVGCPSSTAARSRCATAPHCWTPPQRPTSAHPTSPRSSRGPTWKSWTPPIARCASA
ncbi:hypothetical protein D3C84_454870 [compost metagenome]